MGTTHDHRSTHGHPFHHCPACGATGLSFDGLHRFTCSACGFVFFHNTAAACGAILTYDDGVHGDRVLLLVRANDPAKGKLDFPGDSSIPASPPRRRSSGRFVKRSKLKRSTSRTSVPLPTAIDTGTWCTTRVIWCLPGGSPLARNACRKGRWPATVCTQRRRSPSRTSPFHPCAGRWSDTWRRFVPGVPPGRR